MTPLRSNKTVLVAITLVVIAVLIGVSAYVYVEYYANGNGEEPEEITEKELDDRISPGFAQGLVLEVNRMRHRGLLDEIMKRGRSWKNTPSFYFVSNIDGVEYISKDVSAATGESQEFFTTWDTIFQDNKVQHNADEEQETSEITLTIMEHYTKGLLGLRSENEEKEKITVTYDYRTGRWEGDDDFFGDDDGYGHYLGDTFELWFNIYQTDNDHDYIPYWTEVNVLGTNPNISDLHSDPDNDGATTTWEWRWGYDPFVFDNHTTMDPDQDGLENVEECMMEKWFANPFQKDVYIEVDGMEKGGLFDQLHVFWEESQQIMIERFASHGINMYIDDGWPGGPVNGGGELLPFRETISQDSGIMNQYYTHHFADERKGIFRYLLIANSAGFCHPSEFNKYDTMAVGTAHSILIKRGGFTPRHYRLMLAAMVMHELGHSLGIGPWNVGGNDNITFVESRQAEEEFLDEWGNYRSVMSYYYIYDKTLVDYSDGTNGPGDVNDWELFNYSSFQEESKVIEGPDFELPGVEEIGLIKSMIMWSKLRHML